ncbi:epimerase [Thiohalorhabdus denitrificans]|uniref:UDP-glucose 4-epimerase n=1 Tax=Thiohalorhabdus denitrificans TaxID=381306 RepID=A0A0P9GG96_9GAMM|nr:NAD-dependent epimerase/dehydratase family protein [Thiohalorhabdus denitrificans]KPV39043.1 epimerase [Thiohalorhabdus denitrificans]SCX79137.1 UDP-glucose 4-epimerase [Thiohalorhabdus denitrificans]
MNWLITGGCGFLGTNLIRSLVEEGGHAIRVVDNLSVGTREDLGRAADFQEVSDPGPQGPAAPVELAVGDIGDTGLAERAAAGMDVIVHFAANTGVGPSVEDPRLDCEKNVLGTFNYLEAARAQGVPRFVFASSGAPAGEVEPPIHEELAPHPVSPYGASKLAGEGYCSAYWGTFGIETVALRFGNVYGPGSTHKGSVVAKFLKDALYGEGLEIYGDGTQTRDFIYVDDLIRAVQLAAKVPGIGGETFQIAANTETTVGELAERILAELAKNGVSDIPVIHGEPRVGDVKRNYSDTRKAAERLGWTPGYTLDQGLARTVSYFLEATFAEAL